MKKIIGFLMILILAFPLFALSFSSSLLNLEGDGHLISDGRTSGYFQGFFPLSAQYVYNTKFSDMFSLSLDFSSGLKERLLSVDPDSGKVLGKDNGIYSSFASQFYQVHYSYLVLSLKSALISESFMDEDILSVRVSLVGNFENAYERFSFLSDPMETEGTFSKADASTRYTKYDCVPELQMDSVRHFRQLSHTGLAVGVSFRWMMETEMTKDGVWGDISISYLPPWMPLHDEGKAHYLMVDGSFGGALTLLEVPQMSFGPSSGLDFFSLFVETNFTLKGAWGKDVPQYTVERRVWGTNAYASSMMVANTTKVVLKAIQIMEDFYPSLTLFSDAAFSFGGGLNGSKADMGLVGSIGTRLDMNFFSLFSAYGEIGYVYKDLYDRNPGLRYALGIKVVV